MIRIPERLNPEDSAIARILVAGPTRTGSIRPFAPASSAPARAVFSQGWTTAVGTGGSALHISRRRSYLPVPLLTRLLQSLIFQIERLRVRSLLRKRLTSWPVQRRKEEAGKLFDNVPIPRALGRRTFASSAQRPDLTEHST